jgi:hypothetical protein
MTERELEEARDAAEEICDVLNDAFSGHKVGHIIPAVIFMLARMYDKRVLTKEEFINEISKGLLTHIDEFEEDDRGNLQWLQ